MGIEGWFQISEAIFALFWDKQNTSYYPGTLVHGLKKIF